MKKWDMLTIRVNGNNVYCEVSVHSTNPECVSSLANSIVQQGLQYFSYVNEAGRHRLSIRIVDQSMKGHFARIWVEPSSESIHKDNTTEHDVHNFVRHLISEDNWLPYPGGENGDRFIRYYEQPAYLLNCKKGNALSAIVLHGAGHAITWLKLVVHIAMDSQPNWNGAPLRGIPQGDGVFELNTLDQESR